MIIAREKYRPSDTHPKRKAIQWTGDNHSAIVEFMDGITVSFSSDVITFGIGTGYTVFKGDWIIENTARNAMVSRFESMKDVVFRKNFDILENQKVIRIAIDGPVGCGKSAILQDIARRMAHSFGVSFGKMSANGSEILDNFDHGDILKSLDGYRIEFHELSQHELHKVIPCP